MLSDWLATMEWRVGKSSRWLCLQCIFHTHTFGSDARRSPTANPAALLRALLITYLSLEMPERTLQRSLGASRLIFSLLSPVRLPRSSQYIFPILLLWPWFFYYYFGEKIVHWRFHGKNSKLSKVLKCWKVMLTSDLDYTAEGWI